MAKRFHVTTFGCQMNEHDSERMKGMLESLGYAEVGERADADLILFNTCSIREAADTRFIAHLGEAKRLKLEDPERVVGVGGCWAQSVKDEVFERFPFVDVAFGPGQIGRLAEFLASDSLTAQGYFEFEDFSGHLPMKRGREFQAWLQISQGCNCNCSYCIVPSTRGREESRDPAELIAEVSRAGRRRRARGDAAGPERQQLRPRPGQRERISFAELLARVDAVDGIERIRYTSPHPKDMREDVIRAHAELPALCEHIHLPLQSGSSRILKAMRRTYNRERYLDRVAMMREHVPDCSLTTDIIVGFPGETEEDFAATLEIAEVVGYDSAFTFVFSPRRGTEAATLGDQVPHAVKRERMDRLVEVVQRRARERSQRFVGRTMEVLVEGPTRRDPCQLRGRSRHNKAVNFEGTGAPGRLRRRRDHGGDVADADGPRAAAEPRRLSRQLAGSAWRENRPMDILAIFGPTAVGKTGVAIAVAELLRERGEDPVAISCDAIQVYAGLEILSGAASAAEQARLEHRLLSSSRSTASSRPGASPTSPTARSTSWSPRDGGRSSSAAPACTCAQRWPSSRCDRRCRPTVRAEVESEVAERGSPALHAELPEELASGVHPNDAKRVARLTALTRLGIAPHASGQGMWSEGLRHPSTLIGLVTDRDRASRAHRRARRRDDPARRRGGGAQRRPRGRVAHRPLRDRVRGAARRRRRGDEVGPVALRAAATDLDAKDGGRACDRPRGTFGRGRRPPRSSSG